MMSKSKHYYFLLLSLYFCLISNTLTPINATDQVANLYKLLKSKRSKNPSLAASWVTLPTQIKNTRVHAEPQDGLMEADKITTLPGQPDGVDFDQYAGYVAVDQTREKALFYYFAESPKNSSSKPLILWLNGGPGCSSFGNGGLLELGPFRVKSDSKTLIRNPYAWNNVANVIFLESPAGVGFSYGNESMIYNQTGDISTAKDAYTFLVNWFERFPQYKNRDFYLAGESYAGHYVPQLAYTILHNNKNANHDFINLKGIAIGNAWIDDATNSEGMYDYLWSHALFSDETHAKIKQLCNFSETSTSDECDTYSSLAWEEAGNIDIYNIYAPVCVKLGIKAHILDDSVEVYDPCSSIYVEDYLNKIEVQKALHVKPTKWESCSGFEWHDSPSTVLPVIQELMASNISVWIYSGDVDGRVPVTSSKYSINALKLPIKNAWRPWYTDNQSKRLKSSYLAASWVTLPTQIRDTQAHVEPQDGLMEADKITTLPGQPSGIDFDQYAGYVAVDPAHEKALFYYFVESPENASSKPLVLWLNGGPGCSSFGNGGLLELGPFRVKSDGKTLIRNPYAWNKVANVIFLESPVGVGFSYGKEPAIYAESGDTSTAKDAYTFLVNWFERFPQYKNREFYLAGESYAGHYVPQLAYTILHKNNNAKHNSSFINLKGIAIGNAWVDDATNTAGLYDYLFNHATHSDETHAKIKQFCNFSKATTSQKCEDYKDKAWEEAGNIDIYNIYAPVCLKSGNSEAHILDSVEIYDPCSSKYVTTYLNTIEVQKALHAKPKRWESCSGDVDGRVPVTSSKYSINTLKLPVKDAWSPWYDTDNQVGGYIVGYEGLVFVTVRGAGHLVPSYQPKRALTMFSSFLLGKLPPKSSS
uniref:Carboxypeptidase n=1 Tax=Chenopodium quinoa TaxID=63459 RepID=A0A803KRD9_CHEQI